jgi:DNA-binding transcriptional MerR regulator/effector-binding domain-containing protein
VKFTVGEMAKLSRLSAQTLRYYDKIGLFKPSFVDEETGYRYYKLDQFQKLQMIKYLKFLGTPLEEIKEFIYDVSPETTLEFLGRQSDTIDDKIKQLEKIKNNVDSNISYISKYMNLENYEEVRLEEIGPFYLVSRDLGRKHIGSGAWDMEIKELLNINEEEILYFSGDIGVSVDKADYLNGDYTIYKSAFYFCNKDDDNLKNFTAMPEQLYVMTVHRGNFLKTGKAYERLLEYIEVNDLEALGDSIEITVIDDLIAKCEEDYYLDIGIPVRKKTIK